MDYLPTPSELSGLASALAPGLLILGIRSRFMEAAQRGVKDRLVAFAVASSAYYAAISPLFHVSCGISLPLWLWSSLQFFLLPCVIGMLVVAFDQSEGFYRACSRLGLRLAHHVPAAWDYAFSRVRGGCYVWVKLTDGTEYGGILGSRSFASSSVSERDLFLQEVWSIKPDQPWTLVTPKRSVLLCGKDIKCVEFFERISNG